jgi:hypothetical protein
LSSRKREVGYAPRWKGRTDENHRVVRDGLRALGYSVRDTSGLGGGFPDLLVAKYGYTDPVEVKRVGARGKKRGKVQAGTDERQASFRRRWKAPVLVVESLEEAAERLSALYRARREGGWRWNGSSVGI